MRRALWLVLTPLWLLLLAPGSRADLIERDLAKTLKGARSVEVIKLKAVSERELQGVVLRAPRGRAPGTAVTLPRLLVHELPAVKSDLLLLCTDPAVTGVSFCSWGLDRRGYWALATGFVGHGTVQLPPGLVERSSLELLAAGQPAPDLCLRAKVRLTDEPSRPVLLARIAAATGKGEASGSAFGPASLLATLLVDKGRTSLAVRRRGKESVLLTGPEPAPARAGDRDRCMAVELAPSAPLARTRASLERALAGTYGKVVIARGRLELRAGHGMDEGTFELSVEYDVRRGLRFVCPLFTDTMPHQNYSPRASTMLSFPTRPRGKYLGLASGFSRELELGVTLAEKLAAAPIAGLRWPLRLHAINDGGEVVGEVVLGRRADPF